MAKRAATFGLLFGLAWATALAACGGAKSAKDDSGGEPPPAEEPAADDDQAVFHRDVAPNVASIQKNLLDTHCVACHSGATAKAKLDLTDLAGRTSGGHGHHDGYHGTLIVPGRPSDSMLVLVMRTKNDKQVMPPRDSPIPRADAAQIAAVEAWIKAMPAAPDDEPGGGTEPGEPGGDAADDDEPGE